MIEYLGTSGDHNGVTIAIGDLTGGASGYAGENNTIHFSARIRDSIFGAGILSHESQHEIDMHDKWGGKAPSNYESEVWTERRAYQTEGYTLKHLGDPYYDFRTNTPTGTRPKTALELSNDMEKKIAGSAGLWCTNLGTFAGQYGCPK